MAGAANSVIDRSGIGSRATTQHSNNKIVGSNGISLAHFQTASVRTHIGNLKMDNARRTCRDNIEVRRRVDLKNGGFSHLLLVFLCFALYSSSTVSCLMDYCSTNTFETNSTWLQLTKEVTTTEYAVVKDFKSLHCCAKGYRSIEWYKDERAYPWPRGVSTFILYPEAANQTIYTRVAADTDRGNYTCLMRNDTHIHVHTVMLASVEKPPPAPRATFTPEDQWVELGQPARLYCEAFVGRINLPDALGDVSWKRVHPEGKKPRRPVRLQQDKVIREDEQILGAYLMIPQMRSEDYGQYVCTVSNADSFIDMPIWLHHKVTGSGVQNTSVPWRNLCFVAVVIILVMLTAAAFYTRFGMKLALKWRNASHSTHNARGNDDKEYDALVLYTEADAPLTLEVLIPTLQNKYSYKCINCQLPKDSTNWCNIVGRLSAMSRSVLAVLSPKDMTPEQLTASLKQLHSVAINLTVVLLQGYDKVRPTPKDSNGENLHTILKKTRLVPWRQLDDKNFWVVLQLSLPTPSSVLFARRNKTDTVTHRLTTQLSIELPLSVSPNPDKKNETCILGKNEMMV